MNIDQRESAIREAATRFVSAQDALDALEAGPGAGDDETNRVVSEWRAAGDLLAGLVQGLGTGCDGVYVNGKTFVLNPDRAESEGRIILARRIQDLSPRGYVRM